MHDRGAPADSPGRGVRDFFQSGQAGVIDPRPLAMHSVQKAFKRILEHGGIFIVQLSARLSLTYTIATTDSYGAAYSGSPFSCTTWSFLKVLETLQTDRQEGTEIEFIPSVSMSGLLKRAADGAHYLCVVEYPRGSDAHWLPLATNKYGHTVAALWAIGSDPIGYVLLLPQMPRLDTVIVPLIEEYCTRLSPQLFPYHERLSWLYRPEYELPEVLALEESIRTVKSQADESIRELDQQIESIRTANNDWYTLLSGTGDELVKAVIHTLRSLGFNQVIDVDEEARSKGQDRNLREDVRIHDSPTILVIDVKGIIGGPEDTEATQSEKHALMRAAEFDGKVKPLTIINHQRNIPPHDRNPNPYRQEIINNALQTGLGLMTTWDLFRLARNKRQLGWRDDYVKAVLYRPGRIEPIPAHYSEIGCMVKVWRDAFGIVPGRQLSIGEIIAIETNNSFVESPIDSLQIDGKSVPEAPVGSNCGIACPDASGRYREGMRVFLVQN
jgi:hypothetical protein